MSKYKERIEDKTFKPNPENAKDNVHSMGDVFDIDILSADKINPKPQPWLWEKIIPLHTVTLFAGHGGIGKTQLLLFITACITNGKAFSAGGKTHQLPQGSVIILSGEDDPEYQLIPKLIALGADRSKIKILKMMSIKKGQRKFIDLYSHLHLLQKTIDDLGDVKLIIVDPIHYFIGALRDHITSDVASFIGNLSDFAKANNLAIIINKHLRKTSSGDAVASAVAEVAGSGAWVNCVRQSWVMHPNPNDINQILFLNLKVNITRKQFQSMAYKIDNQTIYTDDGISIETTIMSWFPDLVDMGADEALKTEPVIGKEEEISKWIINFLLECNKKPNNKAMFVSEELSGEAIHRLKFARATYFKVRKNMLAQGIIKEVTEGMTLYIKLVDPKSYKT